MRTIEEINKELEEIREEERKLFNRVSELILERAEVERIELKQFGGKYIRLGKEDLMFVDKQLAVGENIELIGLIIRVDDNRTYDTQACYGEYNTAGSVNFNIRIGKICLTLDEFRKRTLSDTGDIEELDVNGVMEEINRLNSKFSDATSIWGWKSSTNTKY